MAGCELNGVSVSENDGWIAASAVLFNVPLLTNDRIFGRVAAVYPRLSLVVA